MAPITTALRLASPCLALTRLASSPGRARFGLIASVAHSPSLHKRAVQVSSADRLLLYTAF